MGEVTKLLQRVKTGEAGARDVLFATVYDELLKVARQRLSGSATPTQLDPPALVHEAYLRLVRQQVLSGDNRAEFLAYASTVMRNVVVDFVRERLAQKRGGDARRVTLNTRIGEEMVADDTDLEALSLALDHLAQADARSHRIVEMRYFGGLTLEEIGEIESLSLATVKRDWQKARAFLYDALHSP
ncbi:MAG: ECF-type sigma factor [Stagnimonas sp.]|nr:ECF-type sigma factor [Stagnimonas sp.]